MSTSYIQLVVRHFTLHTIVLLIGHQGNSGYNKICDHNFIYQQLFNWPGKLVKYYLRPSDRAKTDFIIWGVSNFPLKQSDFVRRLSFMFSHDNEHECSADGGVDLKALCLQQTCLLFLQACLFRSRQPKFQLYFVFDWGVQISAIYWIQLKNISIGVGLQTIHIAVSKADELSRTQKRSWSAVY